MNKFRIGDVVRISKNDKIYGAGPQNPKDMNGKIIKVVIDNDNQNTVYKVKWDNGYSSIFCGFKNRNYNWQKELIIHILDELWGNKFVDSFWIALISY